MPGGRIYKNESIENAFKRLILTETGVEVSVSHARYLGLYEHFYKDSIYTDVLSGESVSTHYVVNAFEINLVDLEFCGKSIFMSLPQDQNDDYCWLSEVELLDKKIAHS